MADLLRCGCGFAFQCTRSWHNLLSWYTAQFISLGEAHLQDTVFEIVNKSANPVSVGGEVFEYDEVVTTISSTETTKENGTIYAALSGEMALPYGTYEVHETVSGEGYLLDGVSRTYKKTFLIRDKGEVVDLTDGDDSVYNKVIREDFHFNKKAGSDRGLANVAFLVESMTTGEKHVVVTNANGIWDSSEHAHTNKTNANDPESPVTNGAVEVKENGEWTVVDSSKLDSSAGTWFTGLAPEKITWAEDGRSYGLKGELHLIGTDGTDEGAVATAEKEFTTKTSIDTIPVEFEVDTTGMSGKKLVAFETLMDGEDEIASHKDLEDRDQMVLVPSMTTTLTGDLGHLANPCAETISLQDTVTYSGVEAGKTYEVKGTLVNKETGEAIEDSKGRKVTASSSFAAEASEGVVNVNFRFQTDVSLAGMTVIATEVLTLDDVEYYYKFYYNTG